MEMFPNWIVLIVVQVYTFIKNHLTVHLQRAGIIVYMLNLNKGV